MKELRVDIGGSNRGFQVATEQTKKMAQDLNRSLEGYTPETFKGAQMMRDKYGKVFDQLKGGEGIGGLLDKIAGGFGETGHAVMELATGPIGMVTAGLAVMGEAAKAAWESMRESFALARDARTFGVSTTSLKRLDRAGEEQGFDEGEGRSRLNRFTDKVGAAASGDKKTANIFKDMGVEVDGKAMDDILQQVAESFEKMRDPAGRAHKAVELFGRGGQEMIPILHQMVEGGTVLEKMGLGDEQTDAILGGSWKKIHGFFSQVTNAAKEAGKSLLADVISGGTGYKGGNITSPVKVKVEDTPEEKAAKAAKAVTLAKDITAAQAEYRSEVEATSNAATKLAMELGDERDLKQAIAKAEAAHDELEALKLKTELLRKQKEIEATTATLKKDSEDKKKKPEAHHAASGSHIDSLSSAGLFQSIGAVMNPKLEIDQQQLTELRGIHHALTGKKDPFRK